MDRTSNVQSASLIIDAGRVSTFTFLDDAFLGQRMSQRVRLTKSRVNI